MSPRTPSPRGSTATTTRLALLAEAATLLAARLDYDSTLHRVATLAVPSLADYCTVDVVDEDGALRRVAWGAAPFLIREITEEIRAARATSAEHAQLGRALGSRSVLAVPMMVGGQVL